MNSLLHKFGQALCLITTSLFLASCGGSGAGAAGSTSAGGKSALGATTPTTLTLVADSLTMKSDGTQTIKLTATAKNDSNVVLKGATVTFATTDAGASLAPAATITDASGSIQATLGTSDKTTRTIHVTATSGSLTASVDIAVAGTTLAINGPNGLGFNATGNYTVLLKDSAGAPIPGQKVTLSTKNTIATAPTVTDSQGQASFVLSGSVSGTDTVAVTAMGTTTNLTVTVTPTQLAFVTPSPLAELPVGNSQPGNVVKVRLLNNGVPVANTPVALASTRGAVSAASGATGSSFATDATGSVSFLVQSVDAGIATLTATANNIVVTQSVEFVASVPTQLNLQAGPSVVGVNLTAASTNAAQLVARVTDGSNPVKGVRVNFAAVADPSAGTITPAYAISDSYGMATASYFGGAIPSGKGLVKIAATLPDWPAIPASTATLTVAEQAISIRMGESNQINSDTSGGKYMKTFSVLVTDTAGNPISGAKVTTSLLPLTYFTGTYIHDAANVGWLAQYNVGCPSEDVNQNGRLDPGEDDPVSPTGFGNGDGMLTPGNVAAISVDGTTGLTDSTGFATLTLAYPKVYANWVSVSITVTILAPSGTEGSVSLTHLLEAAVGDLNSIKVAPVGVSWPPILAPDGSILTPAYFGSPFGQQSNCRVKPQ